MKREIEKKKRKMIGIIIIVFGILFSLIFSINFTSAEFWACFGRGESVDFCNPSVPDRTCGSDLCKFCMSVFDEGRGCYTSGNFNQCNQEGASCGSGSGGGGGGGIDATPPVLTLNSPTQSSVYSTRSVLFDLDLNEKSDVMYLDEINGRGRWIKVCNNCVSYSRSRNFKEGQNNITIKAEDSSGNEILKNMIFFIDSKNPIIRKTGPKKGFASGIFETEFTEQNPTSLKLNYGNSETGYASKTLNLAADCTENKNKKFCDTNVNLASYDGEQIEYWFELKDIAENLDESKHLNLGVDTTFPVINSIGTEINNKKVKFSIDITELNLDVVEYIDNSETRPRFKRLCTRLKEGICEKQVTLRGSGDHNIDIQVIDMAGNVISENIILEIDWDNRFLFKLTL